MSIVGARGRVVVVLADIPAVSPSSRS
jgi:hypothetical protein